MPTYDYHCPKCKKTYELRESFSAPDRHKCQECGAGTAKRLLTAPTVVFKGSGWYVTDSRSKSTAISESSEKNGSSSDSGEGKSEKSEAKPESKGESKPDAKAEAKPAKTEAKAAAASSSKD